MGEKGNLTAGIPGTDQTRLPSLPKLGSTAGTEAPWDKGPGGGEWPKGPQGEPAFGKPAEAGWDKGPGGDWGKQPGQLGPSVPPPQGPPQIPPQIPPQGGYGGPAPQGPPAGVPPIGGLVASRHADDDQQPPPPPPPPGGQYPPPPSPGH